MWQSSVYFCVGKSGLRLTTLLENTFDTLKVSEEEKKKICERRKNTHPFVYYCLNKRFKAIRTRYYKGDNIISVYTNCDKGLQ